MEGKKRKRESDYPRIIYHTSNRTFDRLFKEDSLKDTREVVRRKLGLPEDANIQLAQLRQGTAVDLEDEEDFEAFHALAYRTLEVDVRVTVTGVHGQSTGARGPPESELQDEPESRSPKKKKRRKSNSTPSTPAKRQASSTIDYVTSESPLSASTASKKRKVAFADFPDTFGLTSTMAEEPSAKQTQKSSGDVVGKKKQDSDGKTATNASRTGRSTSLSGPVAGGDFVISDAKRSKSSIRTTYSAIISSNKGKQREIDNTTEISPLVDDSGLARTIEKSKKKSKEIIVLSDAETSPKSTKFSSSTLSASKTSGPGANEPPTEAPSLDLRSISRRLSSKSTVEGVEKSATKKPTKQSLQNQSESSSFPEQLAGVITQNAELVRNQLNHKAVKNISKSVESSNGPTGIKAKPKKVGDYPTISSAEQSTLAVAVPKKRPKSEPKRKEKQAERFEDNDLAMDVDDEASSGAHATVISEDYIQALTAKLIAARRSSAADVAPYAQEEENTDDLEETEKFLEIPPALEQASQRSTPDTIDPDEHPPSTSEQPSSHEELPSVESTSSPPPVLESAKKRHDNSKHDLLSHKVPCPVCLTTPFHFRYRCPVIIAGPDAIHKRLAELKNDDSGNREQLIEELEELVKRSSAKQIEIDANTVSTSNLGAKPLAETADNSSNLPKGKVLSTLAGLDSPLTSKFVMPSGSHVSEVAIEGQDEGSTDDSSDDDDVRSSAINPIPAFPSYGDELDAIIRGPKVSRSVLDDIPSGSVTDDEEDTEEVVLEDDDDTDLTRRARRIERDDSSDAEDGKLIITDGSESEDTSSIEIHTPPNGTETSERESDSDHSRLPSPVAFQAIDARGESHPMDISVDRVFGQALAEDTAVFTLSGELLCQHSATDSDAETQVESLVGNGKEVAISALQHSLSSNTEGATVMPVVQADIPASSEADANQGEKRLDASTAVPARLGQVDCGPETTSHALNGRKVTPDQIFRLLAPFESPALHTGVDTLTGNLSSRGHRRSRRSEEDHDSIQPADDLQEQTRQPSPIESDIVEGDQNTIRPQSTPKSAIVASMKTRSGQTPLAKPESPVQMATNRSTPPPAKKRGRPRKSTSIIGPDELGEESIAKRTRTASVTSQALEASPPPVRRPRGRPPKSEALKAQEAAAKLGAKEEKARLRKEKAKAKAAAKKEKGKSSSEGHSTSTQSMHIPSEAALLPSTPQIADPGPEPDQWSTLQQGEDSILDDKTSSPEVDELASSGDRSMVRNLNSQDPGNPSTNEANAPPKSPLFILTQSQVPFPYSQWKSDPPGAQDAASLTEPDEVLVIEKSAVPQPRTNTALGPYRKLTDIASQQSLFSTQQITGQPSSHISPTTSRKWDNIYNGTEEDEEDEDEDDSSSDSETEKESHIPQSRRAGAGVQPRKGRGLFSFA